MDRTLNVAIATLAAVVAGTACMRSLPFNHYLLRAPQITSGALGEVRVGGRAETKVESVGVRVSALSLGDSVLIVVDLDSGELGYSFAPMEAKVIARGDGASIPPATYVGPGRLNWVQGTYRECIPFEEHSPPLRRRSDAEWQALAARDTCYLLMFPFDASTPRSGELVLGGLAKGRTRLPAPRFDVGGVLWSNVIDVKVVGGP
jgi:hypothetical protein